MACPDIIALDIINGVDSWESLGNCCYRHKLLKNITLQTRNMYFPGYEGQEPIVQKIYQLFLTAVQRLLQANKVVIFSQHTGSNAIDPSLIKLFNEINLALTVNSKAEILFLLAQSGQPPFSFPAYVYNKPTIDLYKHKFKPVFTIVPLETMQLDISSMLLHSQKDPVFSPQQITYLWKRELDLTQQEKAQHNAANNPITPSR